MKICVFGGQYGSEGKGSVAEYLIGNSRHHDDKGKIDRGLVALGENSPNSGHTCSLGKTRNIPASSYFADTVVLGPDSAVMPEVLLEDLTAIKAATGKAPRVYIHENATFVCQSDVNAERGADGVVDRISSTGSGSGYARVRKSYHRLPDAIVRSRSWQMFMDQGFEVSILARHAFIAMLAAISEADCVFECSQGVLLDHSWGIFPYVTSRTTLPRAAVARNAMDTLSLVYAGVYRTFPIRTGGPSGPTTGKEITFESLGVTPEIATVTKRQRRIFQFNRDDFYLSLHLTRPSMVFFTHLDYIGVDPNDLDGFLQWYVEAVDNSPVQWRVDGLFLSNSTGKFVNHGVQSL